MAGEAQTSGETATSGFSESGEFSAAELAYFESGGEKADDLVKEYGGQASPAQTPPVDGQAAPGAAVKATPPAGADEDPEGTIEIGPDGKPRDKVSGKYVPHQALHKERDRRKTAEAERDQVRDKLTRGEERLQLLMELVNGSQAVPGQGVSGKPANGQAAPGAAAGAESDPLTEDPIDPEVDVFGALKQSQRRVEALAKKLAEKDQREERQTAAATTGNRYKDDALSYARENADFVPAYNHLVASLHAEYEAMGVADKAKRDAMISQAEQQFVSDAFKNNQRPSELLFRLAKARGFTGKAPPPAGGNGQSNGAAPAGETPDPDAVKRINRINEGKAASVTLTGAGGSGGGSGLTMEALANMSEAEFKAMRDKFGAKAIDRIMGG